MSHFIFFSWYPFGGILVWEYWPKLKSEKWNVFIFVNCNRNFMSIIHFWHFLFFSPPCWIAKSGGLAGHFLETTHQAWNISKHKNNSKHLIGRKRNQNQNCFDHINHGCYKIKSTLQMMHVNQFYLCFNGCLCCRINWNKRF